MRRKALLAIVFAGSIMSAAPAAECKTAIETTESLVQKISHNSKVSPENRAYSLLCLARDYLSEGNTAEEVEAQYANLQTEKYSYKNSIAWENALGNWLDDPFAKRRYRNPQIDQKPESPSTTAEKKLLAGLAIRCALNELEKSSAQFAKVNMYFLASKLLEQTGDTAQANNCNKILEQNFQACEKNPKVDEEQIKGAASVLNAMANQIIEVEIPYQHDKGRGGWGSARSEGVRPCTVVDFNESEKLKLRALAMSDRLPEDNHHRRKAHRNLVLWYQKLGKTNLAEQQKEILFKLVGARDDLFLNPTSITCGSVVWWQARIGGARFCGMG